jgi:hypothetical protein
MEEILAIPDSLPLIGVLVIEGIPLPGHLAQGMPRIRDGASGTGFQEVSECRRWEQL